MEKKKVAKLDEDTLFEFGNAEKVQQSQIFDAQGEAQEIREGLDLLEKMQEANYDEGKELISELESLLSIVESQKLSDDVLKSIDEYFEILDKEAQKRSKMVAKSLTKYLKNVQANTKYDELKTSALH